MRDGIPFHLKQAAGRLDGIETRELAHSRLDRFQRQFNETAIGFAIKQHNERIVAGQPSQLVDPKRFRLDGINETFGVDDVVSVGLGARVREGGHIRRFQGTEPVPQLKTPEIFTDDRMRFVIRLGQRAVGAPKRKHERVFSGVRTELQQPGAPKQPGRQAQLVGEQTAPMPLVGSQVFTRLKSPVSRQDLLLSVVFVERLTHSCLFTLNRVVRPYMMRSSGIGTTKCPPSDRNRGFFLTIGS